MEQWVNNYASWVLVLSGAAAMFTIGPFRKILTKIRLFHTRNECLGGY